MVDASQKDKTPLL